MGKTGKNKKRRLALELTNSTPISSNNSEGSGQDQEEESIGKSFLSGLISKEELNITIKTLNSLSKNTELLKNFKPDLKNLRREVFDFHRISNTLEGTGNTLTSRISAALSSNRITDALVLLSEFKIRKQVPKLGTLQRWVRECDAASSLDGSYGNNEEVLKVLDAILRTTMIEESGEVAGGSSSKESIIKRMDEWKMRESSGDTIYEEVLQGLIPLPEEKESIASSFSLLLTTPGPERLPPNLYPALLYTSKPSAIPMNKELPPSISHSVPHVPGAFLLGDVLSMNECRSIVSAAEAVGFKLDKPVGEAGPSILANNLYWLADKDFLDVVWNRIKDSMPVDPVFGAATGLNARFRVYRYVPGSIYRPHYDGRWPASGINSETGEYMYDASPPDDPHWSRYTFLLYLNDSFEDGCTTFFIPSTTTTSLNAYPVKPITGCALVFPHGDARGSLLHEGSPLANSDNFAKYVIRTDVLYRSSELKDGGDMKGEGEGVMDVDAEV